MTAAFRAAWPWRRAGEGVFRSPGNREVPVNTLYQSADWKNEKHVPVIELAPGAGAGQPRRVTVSVGRAVAHPNTTAHHICWIDLYFLPEGARLPIQVGRVEFSAHGAAAQGADSGPVYTQPEAVFSFTAAVPGQLHAAAYCNIHGLWEGRLAVDAA